MSRNRDAEADLAEIARALNEAAEDCVGGAEFYGMTWFYRAAYVCARRGFPMIHPQLYPDCRNRYISPEDFAKELGLEAGRAPKKPGEGEVE